MRNANYQFFQDVIPSDDVLQKPNKAKRKPWHPEGSVLLCPQCGTPQPVQAYDNKTGFATLRCSHRRTQQL